MPEDTAQRSRVGLILTGGGARAAYQVGVLKGIAELLPQGSPVPFPIICGTSAGAINAATLACKADNFHLAVQELLSIWENFRAHKVYRTETRVAISSGLRWFASLVLGGMSGHIAPKSLLDNAPLRALLEQCLCFQDIQGWIDQGVLHAFSITAANYQSGQSVTFYQGCEDITPWKRTRRIGIPRPITLDHLMASSAIPILFPSVRIGYEYYGDGTMRQMAPLSPALHLGADRLLVVGIGDDETDDPVLDRLAYPSLGQIAGYILDTLFVDTISTDMNRLKRINHTLSHIPEVSRENIALRPVELLTLFPSADLRPITRRHIKDFPRSVLYLLRRIGAMNPGGQALISYLLFEQGFCRELIELGYQDALQASARILDLLEV